MRSLCWIALAGVTVTGIGIAACSSDDHPSAGVSGASGGPVGQTSSSPDAAPDGAPASDAGADADCTDLTQGDPVVAIEYTGPAPVPEGTALAAGDYVLNEYQIYTGSRPSGISNVSAKGAAHVTADAHVKWTLSVGDSDAGLGTPKTVSGSFVAGNGVLTIQPDCTSGPALVYPFASTPANFEIIVDPQHGAIFSKP